MKKTGFVGGISWVSTLSYYTLVNEGINKKLGGLNYAECLIYSLNFGDVQRNGWMNSYELLLNACNSLKKAGADSLVLCANTAHLFADRLEAATGLPIIHIVKETARAARANGFTRVGLLGTKFTMEMDFYKSTLTDAGLEVMIPESQDVRDYIQLTLKEELGRGILLPDTKQRYLEIINDLIKRGAEAVILGCTEIPLLIHQEDVTIPLLDSTAIHCDAIVEYAIR